VLKHLLKPKLTLIGVEDNAGGHRGLTRHTSDADVLVKSVPTKYPSGGAKQTIELLTGHQCPKEAGRSMGIMVLNVATVFAIKRAIIDGEPLIERIVTLTGDAFKKPGNAWVRLARRYAGCSSVSSCNRRRISGSSWGAHDGLHLPMPWSRGQGHQLPALPYPRRSWPRPGTGLHPVAVPAPTPAPPPCCPGALLVQPGQGVRQGREAQPL
jgi:hypothetical protein